MEVEVHIDIYAAKFVMRNLFPETEIADGRHTAGTTVSDGCITDTVTYAGLTAGEKYTIKATLVNKKRSNRTMTNAVILLRYPCRSFPNTPPAK